jgi:hypothetical protein
VQHVVQATKTVPDATTDVESELGALSGSMLELEALLSKTRKVEGSKDTPENMFAALAQDKKHKAQKGAGAKGTDQLLPTSCLDYSTTEYGEEEVHVAYIMLAYDQVPIVKVELSFELFCPVLVQSARSC